MEEDLKILEESIKEVEDNKDIGFFETEEDLKFYNAVKHLVQAYKKLERVLDEKFIYVAGARTVYARLMSLDKEIIVKDDLKLRNEIEQHIKENEELKQAYKQQAGIIKNSVSKDKAKELISKIDEKANRVAGTYQYSDSGEDLASKKAQVRYYEYFIRELEELLKGDE